MPRPEVEHIVDGTQTCRRCQVLKPVDQFWKNRAKLSGLSQYCNTCSNLNRKETRHRAAEGKTKFKRGSYKHFSEDQHRVRAREQSLIKEYNITIHEYNAMFNNQNGCCAICNTHQSSLKRPLDVDHDHNTGKIRGLLCFKCNTGIGLLQEDPGILNKAIEYLVELRFDKVILN